MISEEKCKSVRRFGKEILRVSHEIGGFEGISDKIFSFYDSVVKTASEGAMNSLEETAKNDFESARKMGGSSMAFFKRYNYFISCFGEKLDERILKVTIKVSLEKGSQNLMYVENVHFWDVFGEYMMGKNGIKKALSNQNRFVEK